LYTALAALLSKASASMTLIEVSKSKYRVEFYVQVDITFTIGLIVIIFPNLRENAMIYAKRSTCFRAPLAFADCRAEPGRRGTDY